MERSRFPPDTSSSFTTLTNDSEQTKKFYVDLSGNKNIEEDTLVETAVSHVNGSYNVSLNGYQHILPSSFSLSSMTMDLPVKGNENQTETKTVQLISLNADGRMQLQYEGTIVSY